MSSDPPPAAKCAHLTPDLFKGCAALMLLELLFTGSRDAASTGSRSGDAPEADADAFSALIAALDGRSAGSTDGNAVRRGENAMMRGASPDGLSGNAVQPVEAVTAPEQVVADEPSQEEMPAPPQPDSEDENVEAAAVLPEAASESAPEPVPARTDAAPVAPPVLSSHDTGEDGDLRAVTPTPAASTPDQNGDDAESAGTDTPPPPRTGAEGQVANKAEDNTGKAQPVGKVGALARPEPGAGPQVMASQAERNEAQARTAADLLPVRETGDTLRGTMTADGNTDGDGEPNAARPAVTAVSASSTQEAPRDGNETRLAAFARREISASRSDSETRSALAATDKPDGEAKSGNTPPSRGAAQPQLPGTAQPAPPAAPGAGAQNPAMPVHNGLVALLAAQAHQPPAPVEPLTLTTGGENGEIRLEAGNVTLARSETPNAQAARAGSPAQLRLASAHIPAMAQLIAKRFGDGGRSFDIRLDPPELGRVHVRLEIGADRSVQAMLTAEKPEALNELQRHARELERALSEAGLDLGEAGIGFALFEGNDSDGGQNPQSAPAGDVGAEEGVALGLEPTLPPPVLERFGFTLARRAGIDVRI